MTPRKRANFDDFDSSKEKFNMEGISGVYPELGKEVCRILKTGTPNALSPRDAGRIANINFVSINNMRKGDSVEPGTLIKFAIAMGGNINKMLELSGHRPLKLTERTAHQVIDFLPEGYPFTLGSPSDSPNNQDGSQGKDLLDGLRKAIYEAAANAPKSIRKELEERYAAEATKHIEDMIILDRVHGKVEELEAQAAASKGTHS
jgi:hypothetical protein